jgi:hypothetical protein
MTSFRCTRRKRAPRVRPTPIARRRTDERMTTCRCVRQSQPYAHRQRPHAPNDARLPVSNLFVLAWFWSGLLTHIQWRNFFDVFDSILNYHQKNISQTFISLLKVFFTINLIWAVAILLNVKDCKSVSQPQQISRLDTICWCGIRPW